jgi:hypothetical protein
LDQDFVQAILDADAAAPEATFANFQNMMDWLENEVQKQ